MSESIDNNSLNSLVFYMNFFAQKVSDTLSAMTGNFLEINESSIIAEPFHFIDSMIFNSHFYGPIQGDFLIVVKELTALRLAGMYKEGMSTGEFAEYRDSLCNLFSEVLNIAAAHTINLLENTHENLTHFPTVVILGSMIFPKVTSASVEISGDCGILQCGFSLNLAHTKLAQTLQNVKNSLQKIKELVDL